MVFFNLRGSWFMDWNWSPNNFLRAVIAAPRYGLAVLADEGWAWDKLAIGGNLAEVMRHGMRRKSPLRAFQSILGDPTLRANPITPVVNLSAERVGNTVTLRWTPPDGAACFYYVYRSVSQPDLLSGFGPPLHSSALTATTFQDAANMVWPALYQVRACRLVVNGAGSHWTLSQAAFVTVP